MNRKEFRAEIRRVMPLILAAERAAAEEDDARARLSGIPDFRAAVAAAADSPGGKAFLRGARDKASLLAALDVVCGFIEAVDARPAYHAFLDLAKETAAMAVAYAEEAGVDPEPLVEIFDIWWSGSTYEPTAEEVTAEALHAHTDRDPPPPVLGTCPDCHGDRTNTVDHFTTSGGHWTTEVHCETCAGRGEVFLPLEFD